MDAFVVAWALFFGGGIALGRRIEPPLFGVLAAAGASLLALGLWPTLPATEKVLVLFGEVFAAPLLGGMVGAMFPLPEET